MKDLKEFNPMEELITSTDIEIILGVDSDAAEREFEFALNQLNTGSTEMLLKDFCNLKGLDADEVFECLNPPSETWTIELAELEEESEDLEFSPEFLEFNEELYEQEHPPLLEIIIKPEK